MTTGNDISYRIRLHTKIKNPKRITYSHTRNKFFKRGRVFCISARDLIEGLKFQNKSENPKN